MKLGVRGRISGDKAGMSLVEVAIAMALTVLIGGGLFAAGIAALRLSQTNRIMTEAHAFAKQGIESVTQAGYDNLRGGSVPAKTNRIDFATHHVEIFRTTQAIWHHSDGTISTNANDPANSYAQVNVRAYFTTPGTSQIADSTLTTILIKE